MTYSGENHKLGVFNKLTSDSMNSKIRVMGDYQTTDYIKGVIVPTTDSTETWITKKTGTLRKFEQILRRTIRFSQHKQHSKYNWLIQGSCVDLLLVALEHVLDSKKVELRAHIHDSLYLACLCSGPHPGCSQAKEVVEEIVEAFLLVDWLLEYSLSKVSF